MLLRIVTINFCNRFYNIKDVAYICSIYLTILLTIERYIAICHQSKAYLISKSKTKRYIVCVVFFSLIWNFPKCFFYKWKNGHFINTNLFHNKIFKNVYIFWGHAIIEFCLPLTLLIILNSFLVLKVI